jgi:PKD repeat protein
MQGNLAVEHVPALDFEGVWKAVPAPPSYPLLQFEQGPDGPRLIVGGEPPQDPDTDGQYDDINGDGELTLADLQRYFEAVYQQQDSEYVQTNLAYFDFTGDGAITTADVETLHAEVTGA